MAPINAIYLALYRIRTFLSSSGSSKKAYTHFEVLPAARRKKFLGSQFSIPYNTSVKTVRVFRCN